MPASEPLSLRRKRTIFFTAKSPEVANAAHSIFQCCAAREGGGASGLVHIDTHGKDPVARLEAVKRAFHGFEPMGMVQRIVPPPRRAGKPPPGEGKGVLSAVVEVEVEAEVEAEVDVDVGATVGQVDKGSKIHVL